MIASQNQERSVGVGIVVPARLAATKRFNHEESSQQTGGNEWRDA
jgi:hypothetical protein